MTSRPRLGEVLIETALALLSIHILVLAVFRRYTLAPFGLPVEVRDPAGALLLGMVLVGVRIWWNRRRSVPARRGIINKSLPGTWLTTLDTPGGIVLAGFLVVFSVFHYYGGRLGNDGIINYIYVRSLVIDGDLDFTNEFEDFVPAKFQHIAEAARAAGRTPDPSNEPGPAVLWAPAFLLTHGAVKIARLFGAAIPDDGYSYPYVNAVCVSSLIWGFVAVVISFRVCRRYFSPHLAAISVCGLWLSSTLFWYTVFEPSMPHAPAAFVVSWFLWLWLELRKSPSLRLWIGLALLGGLVISVQRYNVFYLLAPLMTLAGQLPAYLPRLREKPPRFWILAGAGVAGAFLLASLPLFLYNLYFTGTFLRAFDLGGFTLRYWTAPRIGEVLFSSNHGLFSWTPAAYVAAFGLVLFLKKDRRLAGTLMVTLAAGVYLLSSTWDWYGGYAFGSRRLTEAFFILSIGFCAAVELLLRRPLVLASGALGLLVAWNLLLAGQVRRGEVPMMGTFSFSGAAARAVERFYELAGHPAAAPASWLFGWRYDVSPGQFDATYGHRPYHNLEIDVGSPADRYFVGKGWSIPESSGDGVTYRWSLGPESTWLVPLFGPFDYNLALTGQPSRHPEGWPLTIAVEVNGSPAATLGLDGGRQVAQVRIPALFWKEGLNEIRFRYDWTVEAEAVYGGEDRRRIALRLEQLQLRIAR